MKDILHRIEVPAGQIGLLINAINVYIQSGVPDENDRRELRLLKEKLSKVTARIPLAGKNDI
jgi:hypothetical protein